MNKKKGGLIHLFTIGTDGGITGKNTEFIERQGVLIDKTHENWVHRHKHIYEKSKRKDVLDAVSRCISPPLLQINMQHARHRYGVFLRNKPIIGINIQYVSKEMRNFCGKNASYKHSRALLLKSCAAFCNKLRISFENQGSKFLRDAHVGGNRCATFSKKMCIYTEKSREKNKKPCKNNRLTRQKIYIIKLNDTTRCV